MVKFAILGGPQGSGKGTVSKELQNRHPGRIFTIETGAMLREIAKRDPDSKVAAMMREGKLIPDESIFDLVSERKEDLMKNAATASSEDTVWILLDGVPRNRKQAAKVQEYFGAQLEFVFVLKMDHAVLEARTIKRRVCPACDSIYNLEGAHAPKKAGVCDKCGTSLIQREDDTPEALEVRWRTYYAETQPALQSMGKYGVNVVECPNNYGEAVGRISSYLFTEQY